MKINAGIRQCGCFKALDCTISVISVSSVVSSTSFINLNGGGVLVPPPLLVVP
jgi:hypothetical protein